MGRGPCGRSRDRHRSASQGEGCGSYDGEQRFFWAIWGLNFKNEAVLFGILGFVRNLEHSGRIRSREILVSVVGNFEPGWFV